MSDDVESLTLRVLIEIRDELKGTNRRIDETNKKVDGLSTRVDGLSTKVDGTNERLDRAVERLDGRIDSFRREVVIAFTVVHEGLDRLAKSHVGMVQEMRLLRGRFDHFIDTSGESVRTLGRRVDRIEHHLGLEPEQG